MVLLLLSLLGIFIQKIAWNSDRLTWLRVVYVEEVRGDIVSQALGSTSVEKSGSFLWFGCDS